MNRADSSRRSSSQPQAHHPLKRLVFFAIKLVALAVALVVIVAVTYGAMMSDAVSNRFDGRRWSLPSRVYSGSLVLYPGLALSRKQLTERLDRLAYHRIDRKLKSPGEYRVDAKGVTVFLREVKLPVMTRAAGAVRIAFTGGKRKTGQIRRMVDLRSGSPLQILELEPEELMQVFGDHQQSRHLVSQAEVPSALVEAVLAAEDADFYDHAGVDFRALFRALVVNARAGRIRQGGSTLTQQLAKNFFLSPTRSIVRKAKEFVIAFVIESKYDKDTILEVYLNEIYLGQRGSVSVHGVGEAARFYFGKPVEQLSVAECATLAGIIRSPTRYSPYGHPKAALGRRNQVLDSMKDRGYLDEPSHRVATEEPLDTVGYAPYVRTAPYFIDYVASQLKTMYPDVELNQAGLSVYTSLDVGVQHQAERALISGLAKLEKKYPDLERDDSQQKLQGAIVVLQPSTGQVLAMVGGRDYGESQFNRVTQAARQPGSAFKPFVYLAALDKYDLTARLDNESKSYVGHDGKLWRPHNYDRKSGGTVTLRHALTHSMNLPTVDLAKNVGLEPIISLARAAGISSDLEPHLSLALGSFEVFPLELAVAYATLAHEGVRPNALSVRSVVDQNGNVIQRQHLKIRTVTSPARAFLLSSILKDVVYQGTGRSLARRGIRFPVAGKTGTTNDYRDAWFVGYTPELVTLVWVGFDDNLSMGMAASKVAIPIWADLMRNIGWRTSKKWFTSPEEVTVAKVCEQTGQLALDDCPDAIEEIFEAGRVPTEDCPEHRSALRRFIDIFD